MVFNREMVFDRKMVFNREMVCKTQPPRLSLEVTVFNTVRAYKFNIHVAS